MTIETIEQQMGMNLFRGTATEELTVGDSLHLYRNDEKLAEALCAGIMVGNKLLDHAVSGDKIAFMLRGPVASLVKVGDELRRG